MKKEPSIEEIISITINCILIRITEINKIERSVLYEEFKEWIKNPSEKDQEHEVMYLRYLKNDRTIN